MAFLLFTFYMVTDPATTPSAPLEQLAFGGAVAATYGLLMAYARGLRPVLLAADRLLDPGPGAGAVLAWVRSPVRSQADRPMPARVAIAPSPVLEVAE